MRGVLNVAKQAKLEHSLTAHEHLLSYYSNNWTGGSSGKQTVTNQFSSKQETSGNYNKKNQHQ